MCWRHKGKRYEKKFGTELGEALAFYDKLRDGGRKPTLRSCSLMFPPPVRLQAHILALNAKDIGWCPSCISLRKFEKRPGFEVDNIYVEDVKYYCPVCDLSTSHGAVKQYNPRLGDIQKRRRRGRRHGVRARGGTRRRRGLS